MAAEITMKYFPIFLTGDNINALIIGGGEVAARKIELLIKSTHQIQIVSATLSGSVQHLIKEHQLTWHPHNYKPHMMDGINLVIAATDSEDINAQVQQEAKNINILVNVVDQPELCSYITPSIIDRSPMIVAISSSGSAPILVRMLREQIEKMMPQKYGLLAEFSFKFRDHVKARIKGLKNRRYFWEQTLRGDIGDNLMSGKVTEAEQQLIASLKTEVPPNEGSIVFIHTMTGNPDFLTLAAHKELQFADAVFYDQHVNPAFLEYVRRDAEKHPQSIASDVAINYQHAIDLAEQGQKIIYFLDGYEVLPENDLLNASQINKKVLACGS